MFNQLVEFLESSFVEQDLDALARGQPTLPMLALTTVGASSLLSPTNFVAKKGRSISQGGLVRKAAAVSRTAGGAFAAAAR